MVVAGFPSIGELIDLAAAWGHRQHIGSSGVLLGSEPFANERSTFAAAEAAFTDEVRRYWVEEEGISRGADPSLELVSTALRPSGLRTRSRP